MSSKIPVEYILSARECMTKTGVLASITLAQAILESGWFKHDLGCFNFFGIKFNPKVNQEFVTRNTREVIHGKQIFVDAKFAKFESIEEGFEAHADLLSKNSRYKPVMEAETADEAAIQLQKCGYATDPQYSSLIIIIMKSNNLYQYDSPEWQETDSPKPYIPDANKK